MWEAKVFAAADAVETNWKHKVTPDWGEKLKQYMQWVVWSPGLDG